MNDKCRVCPFMTVDFGEKIRQSRLSAIDEAIEVVKKEWNYKPSTADFYDNIIEALEALKKEKV